LIQNALTNFKVLKITYQSAENKNKTTRNIQPFAFYYNLQESWLVVAFCLLRNDYRMFRLDSISKIETLEISFEPHRLTLKDFLETKRKKLSYT